MGEVGGSRFYQGGGAFPPAMGWSCPACGEFNVGDLTQGCTACGAGRPGRRIDVTPPPALPHRSQAEPRDLLEEAGAKFWHANPRATVIDGFVAGYQMALAQLQRQQSAPLRVPPVALDVKALAPETREQRTILAALRFFKDQIAAVAEEEIASGEYCSAPELDALIARIERTLI